MDIIPTKMSINLATIPPSLSLLLLFFPSFIPRIRSEIPRIEMAHFLQNEDIKNTWPKPILRQCVAPSRPSLSLGLNCFVRQHGYEQIQLEILSQKEPPVLRLHRFLLSQSLEAIARRVRSSKEVESQGVEGYAYNPGYRGRQADGLWLLHHEREIRPLYERMQKVLAVNPAFGEDFLVGQISEDMILKYDAFGHYAPHFDHLEPMPPDYDEGWFAYFGNRMATALLLVETAAKGGFTVFPRLNLTISPEKGDLLLWFNADSNDQREENALHAACPILEGQKIAVSLWIRGNFQDGLKCALGHAGYEPADLVGSRFNLERTTERPRIPRWVFK